MRAAWVRVSRLVRILSAIRNARAALARRCLGLRRPRSAKMFPLLSSTAILSCTIPSLPSGVTANGPYCESTGPVSGWGKCRTFCPNPLGCFLSEKHIPQLQIIVTPTDTPVLFGSSRCFCGHPVPDFVEGPRAKVMRVHANIHRK